MKIVMIEGINNIKKDNIVKLLKKKTNFEYLIFENGFISHAAYAEINNKKSIQQKCFDIMCKLRNDLIVIYLNHIGQEEDKKVFDYYIRRAKANNIKVVEKIISNKTVETIANELLTILEMVRINER